MKCSRHHDGCCCAAGRFGLFLLWLLPTVRALFVAAPGADLGLFDTKEFTMRTASNDSSLATSTHRGAVSRTAAALAVALCCVVGAAGCPGPEYPKCEKDDQCKKDKAGKEIAQYCLFGQCQECAKDAQCKTGFKCNRGRCDKACTDDAACGVGQMCEELACVPVACSDAKPCGGGLACDKGRCASPASGAGAGAGAANGAGGALNCDAKKLTVGFDFNASDLRPDGRDQLNNFAKCMVQNSAWKLAIEGHADERGTTDFNLQLGERRAGTVRDHLTRLGVDKARMKTISYGEEKPVDGAATESGWAKNRRAELVVQ